MGNAELFISESVKVRLYDNPDLDLSTVYLIDRVQKHQRISKENVQYLRKLKLIEGKMPNIFISSSVAESIGEKGQYIKNKGFDDEKYKGWILNYLKAYQKARKSDFVELLKDSLPDTMDEQQKIYKVQNLLQALRKEGKIETDSDNHRISYWRLSK